MRFPRTFMGMLCAGIAIPLFAETAPAPDAKPLPNCARSVHMWHPAPGSDWFYGEVVVEKSVPGSYFMTIGFSCGYCGVQELYDGRKVAIFSVWDPGDPFDFKIKEHETDPKLRTINTYAGDGVAVTRFGGEGTGGQSMMPFDWKYGEPCRFALSVQKDGEHRAAFTGYIWRDNAWFRIATFSTLQTKGEASIKDVCSFVEDFRRTPESKQQVRVASYLNFFARYKGEWHPVEKGRFTGDANPILTVDAEAVPGGFRLTTGGATENRHIRIFDRCETRVGERPKECLALDGLLK